MASSAPTTPLRRRFPSVDHELSAAAAACSQTAPRPGNRSRLPSSDIPRTYSGLYGTGDGAPMTPTGDDDDGDENDTLTLSPPRIRSSLVASPKSQPRQLYQAGSNLLPFELSRNSNTDWIAAGGPPLLVTYLSLILIFLLTALAFVSEPKAAWTLTNVCHGLVSMVYLHWIKGNPADYMDGAQGEMNAMTLWEQIVSRPPIHLFQLGGNAAQLQANTDKRLALSHASRPDNTVAQPSGTLDSPNSLRVRGQGRDVLCIVPTLLAHASCCVAKYQFQYAIINVAVWAVVMLPKMPFMNGVRILGINRTTGIDDGDYQAEIDDDCLMTKEDSKHSNKSVNVDFHTGAKPDVTTKGNDARTLDADETKKDC